jgi:DNA-3-methyladenine glycosylase
MAARVRKTERLADSGLRAIAIAELPQQTIALAKFLLGKVLVRDGDGERLTGRIVETEAYLPGDPAAHGCNGLTKRNAPLFLSAGHVYVYRAYGISMMLNISSETDGIGAGVLIRAVEPLTGVATMERRRGTNDIYLLTKGPGRLAQAFDIGLSLNGTLYALGNPLWLGDDGCVVRRPGRSVRIGITRNADKPWRFFVRGNRWVSGPTKLNR